MIWPDGWYYQGDPMRTVYNASSMAKTVMTQYILIQGNTRTRPVTAIDGTTDGPSVTYQVHQQIRMSRNRIGFLC